MVMMTIATVADIMIELMLVLECRTRYYHA